MNSTDVILVGAGPIGIELAAAFQQAGVDYVHLEAGQIAQTVSWYPKQTRFFSSTERIAIAGVPIQTSDQSKATREEYLAYLRSVVLLYDLKIHTYQRVEQVDRLLGGFHVHSRHAGEAIGYRCKHLVLALGDMAHPRLLHIPGEDLEHVSHYFDEPHTYFRKRVLIVGGKNSAVEAALRCHRVGAEVIVSYRGERFDPQSIKYWLHPEIESLIRQHRITFHGKTVPVSIEPGRVMLKQLDTDQPLRVEADFVLLLTGYVADTTLFEQLGVTLVGPNHAPQVDETTMQTNVPGVYIAGTAAAGTQNHFRLFIENCHVHVDRILAAITGRDQPPGTTRRYEHPES